MKRGRIYVMVFSAVLVVMGLAPRIMVYFLEYNSHVSWGYGSSGALNVAKQCLRV